MNEEIRQAIEMLDSPHCGCKDCSAPIIALLAAAEKKQIEKCGKCFSDSNELIDKLQQEQVCPECKGAKLIEITPELNSEENVLGLPKKRNPCLACTDGTLVSYLRKQIECWISIFASFTEVIDSEVELSIKLNQQIADLTTRVNGYEVVNKALSKRRDELLAEIERRKEEIAKERAK